MRVTNPTRGIRASCASVAVMWRDQHLRISGDHRLQPFPAYEAVIQSCNSAPPAYDAGSHRTTWREPRRWPSIFQVACQEELHVSASSTRNAPVGGIEQPAGTSAWNKKTGVFLLGDFCRLCRAFESRPWGQTCAASSLQNFQESETTSGRPFGLPDCWMKTGAPKAERSPAAQIRVRPWGAVSLCQPSERMPRTTKPTFAGLSLTAA